METAKTKIAPKTKKHKVAFVYAGHSNRLFLKLSKEFKKQADSFSVERPQIFTRDRGYADNQKFSKSWDDMRERLGDYKLVICDNTLHFGLKQDLSGISKVVNIYSFTDYPNYVWHLKAVTGGINNAGKHAIIMPPSLKDHIYSQDYQGELYGHYRNERKRNKSAKEFTQKDKKASKSVDEIVRKLSPEIVLSKADQLDLYTAHTIANITGTTVIPYSKEHFNAYNVDHGIKINGNITSALKQIGLNFDDAHFLGDHHFTSFWTKEYKENIGQNLGPMNLVKRVSWICPCCICNEQYEYNDGNSSQYVSKIKKLIDNIEKKI